MNICCVFVSNKRYFSKFVRTCNQLIANGKYNGSICLVVGDDLNNDELLNHHVIKNNNITVKYFPDIKFSKDFLDIQKSIRRPPHWFKKMFQYHKFHLFNVYFKQWDYVFYMDCGITVFSDIHPMLNLVTENTLLAHSDAYPRYVWKLKNQFDVENTEYFTKLNARYNLNIDYFQTTMMIYDTKIIEEETYSDLHKLAMDYPISKTNDQGIIALYFTNIKKIFNQIQTHNKEMFFYGYASRNKENKYIMLKSS